MLQTKTIMKKNGYWSSLENNSTSPSEIFINNRTKGGAFLVKGRLFVDMDGTLAEFKQISSLELLFEKNYFLNLNPIQNVIDAIKLVIQTHPDIEVKILSAVLNSKYAEFEKNQWLDRYLPEIRKEDRIFTKYGEDKTSFIEGGVTKTDFLFDDFTKNLLKWQEHNGNGIKLLNGINNTNSTWEGSRIRFNKDPLIIAENIASIIKENALFIDRPLIRDLIIKQYSKEFPAIKYISENTAKIIDDLNKQNDSPLTVKEIRQAHKTVGHRLEGDVIKSDILEFKLLQAVVDDFKKAQLTERLIQAQQSSVEKVVKPPSISIED